MLDKINFHGGKITYDDFKININVPLSSQELELQEDLLQVKYDGRYLIDVGWYPMFDPTGFFLIRVIDSCDWDNPLYKKKVKKIALFPKYLEEAAQFAADLCKTSATRPIPPCEHGSHD